MRESSMSQVTIEKEGIERIVSGFALEAQKQITDSLKEPRKKVLIIAGPTCCGKTAFSIRLAKALNGEIISGDSMQVYKGMDIGTAKASLLERNEIPHHLIDVRPIDDPFNVVDFYYEARHACVEIHARGNLPIIVGGSGFYLHALMYGPPSGPPSVPELRKSLENEIETLGSEVLYERVKALDPQYASTITKNDKQKIVRALEIMTLTGKRVSKLTWKGRKKPLNYDFHCWFVYRPREVLYQRIDRRCEKMIHEGFIEEVEALIDQGLKRNQSACQAIGYRQALDFLETARTEEDLKNFEIAFKQVTRNYAKRQFTWFRKEPLFKWLDLEMHDYEIAAEIIKQEMESSL